MQTTWQQAVDVLLQVVKSSLDVVSQPELKGKLLMSNVRNDLDVTG